MDVALGLITMAGMAALVVAPPVVLRVRFGASWRWFALGIASWVIALVVKAPATALFQAAASDAAAWVRAVNAGMLSAACELGAAALFLRRRRGVGDVLAFGTGIGCFELVFKVLLGSAAAGEPDAAAPSAAGGGTLALLSLAEHASTIAGHAATRVLVYLSCVHRRVLPVALAFTTFTLVDGTATYGSASGWRWQSLGVYGPFVAGLVAVACVEVLAARAFWRRLASGAASAPSAP